MMEVQGHLMLTGRDTLNVAALQEDPPCRKYSSRPCGEVKDKTEPLAAWAGRHVLTVVSLSLYFTGNALHASPQFIERCRNFSIEGRTCPRCGKTLPLMDF